MDREEIRSLTGVRAIASVWVALFHFGCVLYVLFPGAQIFSRIFNSGYLGVDLFFLLSGFVLSHTYTSRLGLSIKSYSVFLGKRLARVYPVHLVMLGFVLAGLMVSNMTGGEFAYVQTGGWSFFLNLLLVQAWGFSERAWNPMAWAISALFLGYLLFPLFLYVVSRMGKKLPLVLGTVACLGALLFVYVSRGVVDATFHGSMPRVLLEMLAGCFLYRLYWLGIPGKNIGTVIVVFSGLAVLTLCLTRYADPWAILFLGLLLLYLPASKGRLVRVLGSSPFLFLGNLSFSLYMTHHFVIWIMRQVFDPVLFSGSTLLVRLSVLSLYWIAMGAAAAAMYYLVERPARLKIRRVFHVKLG